MLLWVRQHFSKNPKKQVTTIKKSVRFMTFMNLTDQYCYFESLNLTEFGMTLVKYQGSIIA
jgi:hypothetical protein